MNTTFSPDAAASVGPRLGRAEAAEQAQSTELPNTESEEWRYSPIGDLPLDDLSPILGAPTDVESPASQLVAQPAATVQVIDGYVVHLEVSPGWAAKGLRVAFDESPDQSSLAITGGAADGDSTDSQTVFDLLHRAFSPGALIVEAPQGVAVTDPIVVDTHHRSELGASFPHLIVRTGPAAEVSVVERQTSCDGVSLSVPVVELSAGEASNLRYMLIQENGVQHWQVGRQRSEVDAQATLSSGTAAFGSRYARTRTDSRLVGRGGTANLVAAIYGDGDQVLDFRTFQDHEARDTRSDLLFKGSQDDSSGSIYTGMIHIHPDGAGSNAFQTNRNIKLSEDAWAWSVPNLEIENNEVHCSHASTVSPVDADQRFFLHARGVPPSMADRLIVAGFYHDVIERLPVPEARHEVTRLIAEKLDRRIR